MPHPHILQMLTLATYRPQHDSDITPQVIFLLGLFAVLWILSKIEDAVRKHNETFKNQILRCVACDAEFARRDLTPHPTCRQHLVCAACIRDTAPCRRCDKPTPTSTPQYYDIAPPWRNKLLCPRCQDEQYSQQIARDEADAPIIESVKASPSSSSYYRYRKTHHWAQTRAEAIERAGRRCERCGTTKHLQVHHKHYRTLGEETADDLVVLCRRHHAALHRGKKRKY